MRSPYSRRPWMADRERQTRAQGGATIFSVLKMKDFAFRAMRSPYSRRPWMADRERQIETSSRPVSRVLYWRSPVTVIHLGLASPQASCNLPGDDAGHANVSLFGLAPGGVCHAVECYHRRGALLPHPFTLTPPLTLELPAMIDRTVRPYDRGKPGFSQS